MSTNLNPKARNKNTTSREKIGKSDLPEQEKEFLLAHPDVYVDFDIPWSMNISYNLSYARPVNQIGGSDTNDKFFWRCFAFGKMEGHL